MITVLLIAFGLYLSTMAPSVTPGDPGELLSAAKTLGVGHPPGYPLTTILTHAFASAVPFASFAYRGNLVAATAAAVAAWLTALLVKRLTGSLIAGIASGLLLAASETFWSQALIAKPTYALNAAFVAGTLLAVLRARQADSHRWLALAAFLAGLGIANHYMAAFFLPGYLILAWPVLRGGRPSPAAAGHGRPAELVRRVIGGSVLVVSAFAMVYLFLPVTSARHPGMDWGHPSTWPAFVDQVRRVQYRQFEFGEQVTWMERAKFAAAFAAQAARQFTPILGLLSVAGLWLAVRSSGRLAAATGWIFLANSVGLLGLLQFRFTPQALATVEVYFLPAFLCTAVWAGWAMAALMNTVSRLNAPVRLLILLLPAASAFAHWDANTRRDAFIAEDFQASLLRCLPRNAFYFASGDNQMFLLSYARFVENRRPDVALATDFALIFPNPFGEDFFRLPTQNRMARRTEVMKRLAEKDPRPVGYAPAGHFSTLGIPSSPSGLVYLVKKPGGEPKAAHLAASLMSLRETPSGRSEYLSRDIIAQRHYLLGESRLARGDRPAALAAYRKAAFAAQGSGGRAPVEWVATNIAASLLTRQMPAEAEDMARRAIAINPLDVNGHMNLGLALQKCDRNDDALAAFREAVRVKPDSADARQYLGLALLNMNHPVEALPHMEALVGLRPSDYSARSNLGVTYERVGRAEEAVAAYQAAIALRPDHVDAWYNLGVVNWRLGRWPEVVRAFEKTLALNPNHPGARQHLAAARAHLGGH